MFETKDLFDGWNNLVLLSVMFSDNPIRLYVALFERYVNLFLHFVIQILFLCFSDHLAVSWMHVLIIRNLYSLQFTDNSYNIYLFKLWHFLYLFYWWKQYFTYLYIDYCRKAMLLCKKTKQIRLKLIENGINAQATRFFSVCVFLILINSYMSF